MNQVPRQGLLQLDRLVLVGIVLPPLFAMLDKALLHHVAEQPHDVSATVLTLAVFIAQIGLLGALCGWLIHPPWLRWTIYGWCWLFVDVQVLTTASITDGGYHVPRLLTHSIFAAQLGLFIIWGMLGSERWVLRLPISVVAGTVVAIPLIPQRSSYYDYERVFLAQALALWLICGVLRWQRFRLMELADDWLSTPIPQAEAVRRKELRSAQFGVRHVLIWMTALAFLLGVLRAFDLLSLERLLGLGGRWVGFATAGLLVAMVLVVALWAALGEGSSWLRGCLLAATCGGSGLALVYLEGYFGRSSHALKRIRWFASTWDWLSEMLEHLWWMTAWVCLAGGLLFASLLIFRVLGYRLLRETMPAPAE